MGREPAKIASGLGGIDYGIPGGKAPGLTFENRKTMRRQSSGAKSGILDPFECVSHIDHGAGHEVRVYENILQLLSDTENPTPLVLLNKVTGFKHAKLYAKLEWYNPFGSVKDRVAANMVYHATESGKVAAPDATAKSGGDATKLVEPTSGNTGLGLQMVANAWKIPLTVPISTRVPAEKRNTLKFMGAELIELDDELCPKPGAREGAIATAEALALRDGYFNPNQYKNTANPAAHFLTTGPEIFKQTKGRITHFFASLGTCGTITGTGRFLRSRLGDRVKIHGVHPPKEHDIPGVRSLPQLKMTEHFKPEEYNELVEVTNAEAFDMCRRLNQEESLQAGPSSGMQVAGALKLMRDEPGNVGVVIFCDSIFKYSSSVTKHCPELFPHLANQPVFEPAELTAIRSVLDETNAGPDSLDGLALKAFVREKTPTIIDVRAQDEFSSKLRARGAENASMAELMGGQSGPGELTQVVDAPGAVQRKQPSAADAEEPSAKKRRLNDRPAAKKVLPADKTAPILLVCNRGIDSLFTLMLLKGAGYTGAKHAMRGMFSWREAELPTEEGSGLVNMPPAKDAKEANLLRLLGYDAEGFPLSQGA